MHTRYRLDTGAVVTCEVMRTIFPSMYIHDTRIHKSNAH